MARLLRSLRRFSNDGAIDNAALECDRARDDALIIEALAGRVRSATGSVEPEPRQAPNAA